MKVTITLTSEQFDQLLITLGIAAGSVSTDSMLLPIIELVNAIGTQSGRPFIPYETKMK